MKKLLKLVSAAVLGCGLLVSSLNAGSCFKSHTNPVAGIFDDSASIPAACDIYAEISGSGYLVVGGNPEILIDLYSGDCIQGFASGPAGQYLLWSGGAAGFSYDVTFSW